MSGKLNTNTKTGEESELLESTCSTKFYVEYSYEADGYEKYPWKKTNAEHETLDGAKAEAEALATDPRWDVKCRVVEKRQTTVIYSL